MTAVLCAFGILLAAAAGFCEPVDTQLRFDHPTSVEWITGERIEIEWNEVLDSRCATGATCVWEGQVTVSVDVVVNGLRTEDVEITLHGEEFERAVAIVEGYRIQLASVLPYPALDVETDRAMYVAALVVSPVTDTELRHGVSGLNTQWRLEAFGEIGEEAPTLATTEVTVSFDVSDVGRGRMWGNGGCNGFTASVEATPVGAAKVSDLAFTEMACGTPAGVMEQEYRFFAGLPNVIGFTMVSDSRLIMAFTGPDDELGAMVFARVDVPTAISSSSWAQVKSRQCTP